MRTLTLGALTMLTITLLSACSGTESEDQVVDIVEECQLQSRYADSAAIVRRFETGGCSGVPLRYLTNHWLRVTVRTPQGGSYIVTLPPETDIQIGDPWNARD